MEPTPPRVDRRTLLRAGAGALALPLVGGAATTATATEQAGYEPLGSLELDEAYEAVVNEDGTVAYVAVGTGFVSVDISDPADPTVVGDAASLSTPDGESLQQVWDVKYENERVLVAAAANGRGPAGIFVFDVSDPANPEQVGDWFETGHGNHNSHLVDGVAYLTGGYTLDMIDVSSDQFERVGQWEPGDWKDEYDSVPYMILHDLYVQDGTAYCAYWDGGTFIVDVSDPTSPEFVGHKSDMTPAELGDEPQSQYLEPTGNDHYVTVNEDATLMAEGGESWDTSPNDDHGGPSGIELFDISDPTKPQELATIEAPHSGDNRYNGGTWTTAHNCELSNDKLYTSWYSGGVTVHDVSDPANPESLSWWADADKYAFWTAQSVPGNEFFVASSCLEGSATTAGLLTFPDEPGQMASDPEDVWWGEKPKQTTTTTEQQTTAAPTTTTTTTTEQGETESTATTEESEISNGTPGFGVLAALGGLGLGVARFLRGRDE
ncbi:LVIVD repeat-containing protein [Haloarchaeobius sp. DFWS5]|uniref:LVIVD repeat-containing protein n=1 Tax=Haloarchaeobius sp. DFWS5 TaxID=3446114 RepID=UPI003EBED2F3